MVSSLLSNDTSLTDTSHRQKMGFVERLRHFGTFRICGRLDQGARVVVNIMGRVRVVDSDPSEC